MRLSAALDDYRRVQSDPTRFPGERRSTEGLFSGLDDRLVHVEPNGTLKDYTEPISSKHGIERARFALELDGDVRWLSDFDEVSQSYHGATALVETRYETEGIAVETYDLTIGEAHITHVVASGDLPPNAALYAIVAFAPDGREARVGQLVHDEVVEVYHRSERDYLTSSTGFDRRRNRRSVRFDAILDAEPSFADPTVDEGYVNDRLGGTVVVVAPLDGEGRRSTTLASLLADAKTTARDEALGTVRSIADGFDAPDAVRHAARSQAVTLLPDVDGLPASAVDDLRVLQLLSAPTGARIAGPDFDPFYANSGGYGYTWFRDDAEIATFLLEAERDLDVDLRDRHAASARFYCRTQREDGTWPHRVWAHDGSLAPGWANARLEGDDGVEYQADQTASVAAFLARYLRERDPAPDEAVAIERAIDRALDGLDATLGDDGLPEPCQNAWEDATGRFTHTTATFLHAYADLARAPIDPERAEHAAAQARRVYEAIDDLRCPERGTYAMRLYGGELDDRLDSSTFALVDAHVAYAALDGVDSTRLARLEDHVETTIEGLYRETDEVAGLVRYEGDAWRRRDQGTPKVWTVSTAWGAHAAAGLASLLESNGRDEAAAVTTATDLLEPLLPGGRLCLDTGYLPEQVFDDGTPDSATPLGWPHAIRLATLARLQRRTVAREPSEIATD